MRDPRPDSRQRARDDAYRIAKIEQLVMLRDVWIENPRRGAWIICVRLLGETHRVHSLAEWERDHADG